jgi:quinol monooxygenase YgiN
MHARVNTLKVQPNRIDDLVAVLQPLLPSAKQQAPGLKSLMIACDRSTGKLLMVSRWETEAAAEAAESVYQEAVREIQPFIEEAPTRERYEILIEA